MRHLPGHEGLSVDYLSIISCSPATYRHGRRSSSLEFGQFPGWWLGCKRPENVMVHLSNLFNARSVGAYDYRVANAATYGPLKIRPDQNVIDE